jgi:HK97 gp10 family phage protein
VNSVSVFVTGRSRVMRRVDAIKVGARVVQRHVATEAGKLLRDKLRSEAPDRTGNMRRKIGYKTNLNGDGIEVRFDGPWYTHFVTKGTQAHDIWAGFYTGKSDTRWLFFEGSGVTHVSHPGSPANDFVHRAYRSALGPIREMIHAASASLMGR